MISRIFIIMLALLGSIQPRKNKNKTDKSTIIFGGDVSFSGAVKYFASKGKGCDYKKPFDFIEKYLQEGDLRVVNLESAILKKDPEHNSFFGGKSITAASEQRSLQGLRYAGIDLVSLANNHLYDFGPNGVKSTIEAVNNSGLGIIGVGYGKGKLNSQVPVIKHINGNKIGFLAYCLVRDGCENIKDLAEIGPAVFTLENARLDINALLKQVDIVVVIMHWGIEYINMPSLYLRNLAQTIVEMGASVIVGSHSHVILPHEVMQVRAMKMIVAYGLGNLIYPPYSINTLKFIPWGKASEKDAEALKKTPAIAWDPTQFGNLMKLSIVNGLVDKAWILTFTIKMNKTNNCLQPTPSRIEWRELCSPEDRMQCPDLTNIFSGAYSDHFDQN